MHIKDETTAMVRTLGTLPAAERPRFLSETLDRFQAILSDHIRGPLDDPEAPNAPVDPTVDPRNIFFTLLMLDKTTLLKNIDGKFAQFINGKWIMAMDIFVQIVPLKASADELRQALCGITLEQMYSESAAFPAAYADDAALLRQTLLCMDESTETKLAYLEQFAQLLG